MGFDVAKSKQDMTRHDHLGLIQCICLSGVRHIETWFGLVHILTTIPLDPQLCFWVIVFQVSTTRARILLPLGWISFFGRKMMIFDFDRIILDGKMKKIILLGIFSSYPKMLSSLVTSGYLKPKETRKVILREIRFVWSLKVLFKRKRLITKRLYFLCHWKTLLELWWHLELILI